MLGHSQSSMMEEEFDLGIENGRRESNIRNDDDYDYALELVEDEEYRFTAQAMQEVKDFPDEITGKTFSPARANNSSNPNSKGIMSSLYEFGKKRLSMVGTKSIPKSPDIEIGEKKSLSHKDFMPASPEEDKVPRRSSMFGSRKSNSPATTGYRSPTSRLSMMEQGILEEKEDSNEEDGFIAGNDDLQQQMEEHLGQIAQQDEEDKSHTGPMVMQESEMQHALSKREFRLSLKKLDKRRKWAETAIRRESQNFIENYDTTGKAAMDRFIVLMSRGVVVRRHQASCHAEEVRLFSDDGCHSINWESPKKEKAPTLKRENTVLGLGAASLHDGSAFDCCITVCGCGDNLQDANDLARMNNPARYAVPTDGDDGNGSAARNENGGWWSSIRFNRHGSFTDESMVAIQPATRDDPTRPGYIGTHALRASKDPYNQALSFSVVTRFALGGVSTLDIECASEDEYFVLLSGFLMLCTEAHFRHAHNKKEKLGRSESNISQLWRSSQAALFPPEAKKMDPIDALFYVSSGLMLPLKFNTTARPEDLATKKDYDVIPPSQFLGWNSAGTQIWARLRLAGLDVKCVFSWDLRRVILKLKCPQWRLEEVAEKMHMKLKKRDGTFKRFKRSRRGTFVAAGYNGSIFRSSERQRIIDFILRSKIVDGGAELDEDTKLGMCIKSRFPLHMHERLIMLKHSWVTFWKIEQPGEISTPWSIFETPIIVTVQRLWTSAKWTWDGLLSQPLDSIAEYYGEDVAFYFAWMSFFSRWLILPSILGLIVFCAQVHGRRLDHWLCIPYAVIIIMWSCVLLAFWRQKAATLAHRWGVLDYEVEETERPQFRGKYAYDANLGEIRKLYPSWMRFLKYCVSYPLITFFVGSVLILMIVTSTTNEALSSQYERNEKLDYAPRIAESFGYRSSSSTESSENVEAAISDDDSLPQLQDPKYWVVNLIYPSIYGLITNIAAELFEWLAITLTDFENHQTESNYWNQLIIKVFSVRFVTVFTSIFYYAFKGIDSETSYKLMSLSIFAFLTIGDWWGKFIQICVPSWIQRFRLYRMKAAIVTLRKHMWSLRSREVGGDNGTYMIARRQNYLTQAQEQCWQEALKKDYSTFGDYTRLMIQLGFVLFFAAVFPLSPLIVLINNIFFIRLDAFKLTNTRKRPIAQKSAGLGVWEDILQVMSVAGIITNCCIVGITSSVLPRWLRMYGTVGVAVVLFFFEHIMLLFKYMLHKAIPRIPITVQREIIGIRPSGEKAKKPEKQRKTRPKFVKEYNLHDDDHMIDSFGDRAENILDDSHTPASDRVDLYLDNDENEQPNLNRSSEVVREQSVTSQKERVRKISNQSIVDEICSELSEDNASERLSNMSSKHRISQHSSRSNASKRQSNVSRSNRRRSSMINRNSGGIHGTGTSLTSKAIYRSPQPRRSAIIYTKYTKNHPLAEVDDSSDNASASEGTSSNDDVSVTRLKMKIQALKRKGKKLKESGKPVDGMVKISRSRSHETSDASVNEDESPTSRARRRIAQSNRIPFDSYPAIAILPQSTTGRLELENAEKRKRSSIIDPSLFITQQFLHRASRTPSRESQDERVNQKLNVELSPSRRGTFHENQSSDQIITTTHKERQKSIASTAWDFVRGIGFSSNAKQESGAASEPLEAMVMEERQNQLPLPADGDTNSATGQKENKEFRLPTYEESQEMELVRKSPQSQKASPQSQAASKVEDTKMKTPPLQISPTISVISRGSVKAAASAINTREKTVMAPKREVGAYQAHVERYRNNNFGVKTPLAATAQKVSAPVHSSSPLPRPMNQKPLHKTGSMTIKNNVAKYRPEDNPKTKTSNEWENIPESACFLDRLKEQRRQSTANSPFEQLTSNVYRGPAEEEYEESPESVETLPKQKTLSPPKRNLTHEYYQQDYSQQVEAAQDDDDEYEPSPADRRFSFNKYQVQYREDYEEEYEESPVSNSGRKSIMRPAASQQENISHQNVNPDYDDEYEESPPHSPPRRQVPDVMVSSPYHLRNQVKSKASGRKEEVTRSAIPATTSHRNIHGTIPGRGGASPMRSGNSKTTIPTSRTKTFR